MVWITYAAMWISASAAVTVGMCITKSAWCLWALLIPACVKLEIHNKSNDAEDDEKSK